MLSCLRAGKTIRGKHYAMILSKLFWPIKEKFLFDEQYPFAIENIFYTRSIVGQMTLQGLYIYDKSDFGPSRPPSDAMMNQYIFRLNILQEIPAVQSKIYKKKMNLYQ